MWPWATCSRSGNCEHLNRTWRNYLQKGTCLDVGQQIRWLHHGELDSMIQMKDTGHRGSGAARAEADATMVRGTPDMRQYTQNAQIYGSGRARFRNV